MAETVDRFRQGMDELRMEGRREGQEVLLRQMTSRRFGEETAGRLSALLDDCLAFVVHRSRPARAAPGSVATGTEISSAF